MILQSERFWPFLFSLEYLFAAFFSTHRFAWDFIEFPWTAVRNQFHIHWFSHPALQALGYINGSLEKWVRENNGATSDRYDISVALWRSHMGFLCHACLLVFISNLCNFWCIWVHICHLPEGGFPQGPPIICCRWRTDHGVEATCTRTMEGHTGAVWSVTWFRNRRGATPHL